MKQQCLVALALLVFASATSAQDEVPTFRASTRSALVWDENLPDTPASSKVSDPLTGREIHKLSHEGIEVSSRMGYEGVGLGTTGKLLNLTTTIANHADSDATVQYGGAIIDGRATLPLRVAPTHKGIAKRDRKNVWELSKMSCFTSGFASLDHFFSEETRSRSFVIPAQTAMTISVVVKDPRNYSVTCSVNGCQVNGTIRYYITVNGKDYVFVWPGKSVIYCGR